MLEKNFIESKSLSPVTIASALPAKAHSKTILSLGSRQSEIFSEGWTKIASALIKVSIFSISISLNSKSFTERHTLIPPVIQECREVWISF